MLESQTNILDAVIFAANREVNPENSSVLCADNGELKFSVSHRRAEALAEMIERITYQYPALAESKNEVFIFCDTFLTHFLAAQDIDVVRKIVEMFGLTKRVLTPEYVLFWQGLLVETASLGFPSIGSALDVAETQVSYDFGLHITDPRIILAFRIYVADLLLQSYEKRQKEVKQLAAIVTSKVTEGSLNEDDITAVASLLLSFFGSMPSALNGKVDAKSSEYPLILSTAKKTYSRQTSPFVYIPDMEAAEQLVKLGKDIFDREPKSNQTLTFRAVGKMTAEQLETLFPDIFDVSLEVGNAHKRYVEVALGMSYESLRGIFIDLFPKKIRYNGNPEKGEVA